MQSDETSIVLIKKAAKIEREILLEVQKKIDQFLPFLTLEKKRRLEFSSLKINEVYYQIFLEKIISNDVLINVEKMDDFVQNESDLRVNKILDLNLDSLSKSEKEILDKKLKTLDKVAENIKNKNY
ncbi:hypothetical protein WG904_18635 [Pedobacter sp. Du54]|uniref:hypothetical protein n=1 Tax=Pedobacter anseongensis TaxID=3133439 RepID=UPI0030B0332C